MAGVAVGLDPHSAITEKYIVSPTSVERGSSLSISPSKASPVVANQSSLSNSRTAFIIFTLTAITISCSMNTGFITIGIPRIAIDLELPDKLLLWPATVYSLSTGCCLLLAGSIADIVGHRIVNLCGTLVLGVFILASGLARTGLQLILFRTIQGIGVSMCLPTSVGILMTSVPSGKTRNIGFSCMGLGTPFGFSVGLILGGVFEITAVGWRLGFYVSSGATLLLFAMNCICLPKDSPRSARLGRRLATEIDWIGLLISSISLGIFSYIFAMLTGDLLSIKHPANICLLVIAALLLVIFPCWMHIQEAKGRPALIPNSIWKNSTFSSICIMVLMSWAALQSMEWFFSLFFQRIQGLSVLQASIRFLPNVIVGVLLNIGTGLLVDRIPTNYLVVGSSALCTISPLLMAIINPSWSWWWCAFWAMLLVPLSVDVIFTVASLVITDSFPTSTQALAGAVFNTMAQFGTSIGIAIMAVISSSVSHEHSASNPTTNSALMQGYRAAFWGCFALMIMTVLVGIWGLRSVYRVGR